MSGPVHLARRFVGSLSPRPLATRDADWVRTVLRAGELELWDRMSRADRTHAAGVARQVDRLLDGADRPVLAAALLHDVGKIDSGLGTFARVGATMVRGVVGRSTMAGWSTRRGLAGRLGRYVEHDQIGAALLTAAGADPSTATWAREHHLDPDRWTLPADLASALAAADDD